MEFLSFWDPQMIVFAFFIPPPLPIAIAILVILVPPDGRSQVSQTPNR